MTSRNFREFAVAYSILNLMEPGKQVKANSFVKELKVSYHIITRVTSKMAKAGLIEAKRGYASSGLTKFANTRIEDAFKLFEVEITESTELTRLIAKALKEIKYTPKTCGVCDATLEEDATEKLCVTCEETTAEPLTTRLAKCGHPSPDRYFSCRECQPILPDEDLIFESC